MSEEYLDIVDENGNLTGEKELRSIVHEKGLRHRTVHIFCYRFVEGKLEFIVHLRSKDKDRNPNKWASSFGGHVESGCGFEDTFKKELQEEAGINLDPAAMTIGMRRLSDRDTNSEVVQVYYFNYTLPIETLKFSDGEVQQAKWMNVDEIKRDILANTEKWAVSIETQEMIEKDFYEATKK